MSDAQFPVTRLDGPVYQVTDGGVISRLMGVEPIQWQLIARTRDEIPQCIEHFEKVIASLTALGPKQPLPRETLHGPPMGISKFEHAKVPKKGEVTAKPKGHYAGQYEYDMARSGTPVPSLDDLGLLGAHKWRLTNAEITSVTQLLGLTEADLLAKKGIGNALVARVKKGLKKHKLRLAAKVGKKKS